MSDIKSTSCIIPQDSVTLTSINDLHFLSMIHLLVAKFPTMPLYMPSLSHDVTLSEWLILCDAILFRLDLVSPVPIYDRWTRKSMIYCGMPHMVHPSASVEKSLTSQGYAHIILVIMVVHVFEQELLGIVSVLLSMFYHTFSEVSYILLKMDWDIRSNND